MNSKDIIEWLMQGCFDTRIPDCFEKAQDGDIYSLFDNYTAEEIVEKIKQLNTPKEVIVISENSTGRLEKIICPNCGEEVEINDDSCTCGQKLIRC